MYASICHRIHGKFQVERKVPHVILELTIAVAVVMTIVVLVIIAIIVALILRRNVLKSEPDEEPEFAESAAAHKSMADQIAAGVSLTHRMHSVFYGRESMVNQLTSRFC